MPTPWGVSQTKKEVAPGVYWVTTAGHGGIMMGMRKSAHYISIPGIKCSMAWGVWACFEEDCLINIVMYERPEWFVEMFYIDYQKPELGFKSEQDIKKIAEEGIRAWIPEYFNN